MSDNHADYIKIFIDSSAYIFQQELQIQKLQRRNLSISTKPLLSFPILGIIGFLGKNLAGQITYSVSQSFVESITAKMIPNKLPHERKKFNHSCMGRTRQHDFRTGYHYSSGKG